MVVEKELIIDSVPIDFAVIGILMGSCNSSIPIGMTHVSGIDYELVYLNR